MVIRTRSNDVAAPIRALIESDAPRRSERYQTMLDNAINAYEQSKVVSDRELELLCVGVEMPGRWAVALHSN